DEVPPGRPPAAPAVPGAEVRERDRDPGEHGGHDHRPQHQRRGARYPAHSSIFAEARCLEVRGMIGALTATAEEAVCNAHEWFEVNSGWAPPDEETLAEWAAEDICRSPDD